MILPDQLQAVAEISHFLRQNHIPHFVMGGLANAIWGRPRTTLDADLKILVAWDELPDLVQALGKQFQFRVDDPLTFAQEMLVLLLQSASGIPLDLVVGLLPYEEVAAARAQTVTINAVSFPVCTAEDLIVHKVISERPQDWLDIEGVLQRQAGQLDINYLNEWVAQFAELLEKQEIWERYVALRDKATM
jgi:hypothetical protein